MIKKIVATLGLLTTVAYAQDSDAGCGMTFTFINGSSETITVLEVESRVTGAPWASVWASDFNIPAKNNVTKAIELKTSCAPPHDFRVKYKKGNSTLYETKGPVATVVDHKVNINLN